LNHCVTPRYSPTRQPAAGPGVNLVLTLPGGLPAARRHRLRSAL